MSNLIIDEVKLSFVFKSSEPIPEDTLLSWLLEKGFQDITDVPKRIGTSTFGIERLNIARKGTCQVLYDPRGGNLGVAGNKLKETLKEFVVIESMLKEKGFNLSDDVRFIEFVVNSRLFVKGKLKPLEKISEFIGVQKMSKFSEIMGEDVIPFDIRFCPKREAKASEDFRKIPEWFDIHVHPYISNPNYYSVHVVFRDTDLSNVKKFAETVSDKIVNIIKMIVGET
ncbi:hypothetical protein DRO59_04015 [Candidatus Bathyarchaeota archaeon]|nr:MAG: hypothetical protein DRO59_04015 [Candidatus Bathyarchaeota archaeon]